MQFDPMSYEARRAKERLPKLLFYRYEAWQYLTEDAAVKGLAKSAANAILDIADIPELWNLPEQYLAAVKEGVGIGPKYRLPYSAKNVLQLLFSPLLE